MEKEFNVDTKIETVTDKNNNQESNSAKKYYKTKEIKFENKDNKDNKKEVKETEDVKLESKEVKLESKEVKETEVKHEKNEEEKKVVEEVKVSKNKGKVISVSPLHIIVKNDKGHAFRFNGKYNVKVGDTFEY